MQLAIAQAEQNNAHVITELVGALLHEIMEALGAPVFAFEASGTEARLRTWLDSGQYAVLLARTTQTGDAVGFLSLYESYALYAGGPFGTIPEFYVRPDYRARGVGSRLLAEARRYGRSRGWTRLEVTTPPLPQFDRTLSFYERQGFSISGGRKMKLDLT